MKKKKTKKINLYQIFVKLILFFSSYIPLILIVILQLLRVSLEAIKYKHNMLLFTPSTWVNIFKLKYINWIIFLLLICVLSVILLKIILVKTNDHNLQVEINIVNVNNINSHYITNYLSVYIFPFITLNMTLLDGLGTAIILIIIIGYVYIKNDILYINPILNILFGYNIYSAKIEGPYGDEVIILSRKDRVRLKKSNPIDLYRIGYTLFIEI